MHKFMERTKFECRDNSRTPFQWENTPNAGFTTGTPWISVNSNYKTINAAAQENDPYSCLNYFRSLVKLRRNNLALVYGKYTLLDKDNPNVYAYTREWEGKKMLILLNFTAANALADVKIDTKKANALLSNYKDKVILVEKGEVSLRPYEALICELD